MVLLPPWFRLSLPDILEYYKNTLMEARHKGELEYDIAIRLFAEQDLFFLLTQVLNRADMIHPWVFARAREFQENPNGYLDLWAREHYKSTIITFGGTIYEIIQNPEITIGFFSHTRPIAKQFLRQIKQEMESNERLPRLWPKIFWQRPSSEAPKWSEDDGIIVKRRGNPKEATIEAWGLVDGQPTSKHFGLRVYDDIVTEHSVGTPDQIEKTTKMWEMSDNLGTQTGHARYAGTRYHLFDTYAEIAKRETPVRVRPATVDGTETGIPVLLSPELLRKKRVKQGVYTFASQMLLNPVADKAMGFKAEWVQRATVSRTNAKRELNIYLLCDPASEKRAKARKDPDFTTMWVIGCSGAQNYYLLDGIRDRINLTQRARKYIDLHRKWQPYASGYEQYGLQADIEHIKYVQEEELYQFEIIPLGGQMSKPDRIKQLVPVYEDKRFYIPNGLLYTDYTGATIDLARLFLEEEYSAFPVLAHDDMLDCMARILDPELGVVFPDPETPVAAQEFDYNGIEQGMTESDWQTA